MSKLQIVALISLISSHAILVSSFVLDNSGNQVGTSLFAAAWILGVVSALTHIFLADRTGMRKPLFIVLTISSFIWILPFLLFTYFGIPFILIFLGIAIHIHLARLIKA